MTKVSVDEEKIIITNSSGNRHVKDNIERIFGVGEWDNIFNVKYWERWYPTPNPLTKSYELVSGHIPKRALKDLKKSNLIEEYFE